jgi:hypothetical protein
MSHIATPTPDHAAGQPSPAANHPEPVTPETPNPSTGPRTEAGKAVSSRNAVKHNLCSTRLTGTDLEEFQELRAKLEEEWGPATETEHLLLDQMALGQWRMDRALSLELSAFNNEQLDEKLLTLALRYRTTAERAFYKSLSELQQLRKARHDEALKAAELEEKEREAAVHQALDRLCFAPIAGARQFVLQNNPPAPPISSRPDPETLKTRFEAQLRELDANGLHRPRIANCA